ncbi:glutamine amidotransferase [Curtobacterium sp. 9128]|uniref:glutamine amidotransferase n=1 Tax=Curtobacterium sp. 9128 TaxID=1793722 RepID=UPI00119E8C57|nr:glutamine amidotransferase [Curtobacterium sp. 9128]
MSRVLLAGESWTTTSVHTKGFDSFTTSVYEEGAEHFIAVLEHAGHQVEYQPNHIAADRFPYTATELDHYDVVVLSDIGANTLLLPSSVFLHGIRRPNRLQVLADWVDAGGALLMVGGYLSFQGIEAKANYRGSPLAAALPVELEIGDDRVEAPHGAIGSLTSEAPFPVAEGPWPPLLGYHRFSAKADATVVAEIEGHPLAVLGRVGRGRSAALGTDMGPHWVPTEFLEWPGYSDLMRGLVEWLAVAPGREAS